MLKLFEVTFNDGKQHDLSLPKVFAVAKNLEEAISKAKENNPNYKNWNAKAKEVKIEGYKIIIEKIYSICNCSIATCKYNFDKNCKYGNISQKETIDKIDNCPFINQ